MKSIADVNKGGTFAPAEAKKFIEILARRFNHKKIYFQKRFKKACEI